MSLNIHNQNQLKDIFSQFATMNSDDPKKNKIIKKENKGKKSSDKKSKKN